MTKQERLSLMGQIVTVTITLKRQHTDYDKLQYTQILLETPRAGWVTGFRTKYEGAVRGAQSINTPDGWEEDPAYLAIENSIPVILVAYWPTQEPVFVPLHGYSVGGIPQPPYTGWSPEAKQRMSEWSKDFPRDSRGRFTK